MYHDNPSSRSPGSQRHQQPLHRQPSRQFDAYGPMPSNPYEDPLARYDTGRLERLNPLHAGSNYGYELSGSQTWNPNGFNGAHTLGGIGSATGRMKPSGRGRAGLPTVCSFLLLYICILPCMITDSSRLGWTTSQALLPWAVSPPARCRALKCNRLPVRTATMS
jgi:hypothetical protein